MRSSRVRRNVTGSQNSFVDVTPLIEPKIENLTIGPVPTDATNVVLSRPNDLGITDKLNSLITEYQSEIVQLPSTGTCASAITAKFPREFVQALYDMLNVSNNGCLQETQTFLQMLTQYLTNSTDPYVNIPRNFWKQIGRVFNELNVNESKLNMYAAAVRTMAMALTSDVQSLPSNNMLVTTLETLADTEKDTIKPVDEAFEAEYPEMLLDQPDPSEILTEVITNIPTTIGESSSNPPTNIVETTASESSDNIQIHDLDDTDTLEGKAYIGLKSLFSMKTLGIPISQLKIIQGGKVESMTLQDVQIPSAGTLNADGKKVDFTFTTVKAYVMTSTPIVDIDTSKSLIEQDWAVVPETTRRTEDGEVNYINTTSFTNSKGRRMVFPEGTTFKGVHTKRVYNLDQMRGLSSALSGLWNKVVSMNLPSPETVQTGTTILATGLGAMGKIFGCAGLVKASNIVGSINDGLGSFIANLKPTNGLQPTPSASITKNALSVVPGVIEAGKSIYEGISSNAQHQRLKLSGMKNSVEAGYTMTSQDTGTRSRIRRVNNIFY